MTLLLPHGTPCALMKMPLPLPLPTSLFKMRLLFDPSCIVMPPASQPGPTTPAPHVQYRTLPLVVLPATCELLVCTRLMPHAELFDASLLLTLMPLLARMSMPIACVFELLFSTRPLSDSLWRISPPSTMPRKMT